MDLQRYQEKLPLVSQWVATTLREAASRARPVSSFPCPRLARYYSQELLQTTKVVVVDRIPVPPLTQIGLPEFSAFDLASSTAATTPSPSRISIAVPMTSPGKIPMWFLGRMPTTTTAAFASNSGLLSSADSWGLCGSYAASFDNVKLS